MSDARNVLEVLKARLGEMENEQAALLGIERARAALLCYCNIPLSAEVPQGLFEAWCMAAEEQLTGAADGISSISEGDVSISFSRSGAPGGGLGGWKAIANRFRQLAV